MATWWLKTLDKALHYAGLAFPFLPPLPTISAEPMPFQLQLRWVSPGAGSLEDRCRPTYPRAEESLCTQSSPAPFSSPGSWWGWQMNNRREAIPQKNKHNSKGSTDGSTRTGVPLGDIRPGLQNARLDESQAGIKTAMRNINNFRYADDTTLTAESETELKSLLMKVKEETGKSWLKTQHSENSDHGI